MRRAGIKAGHRRGDAGFVDKDQILDVDLPDPFAERRALLLDIGAILLAGV